MANFQTRIVATVSLQWTGPTGQPLAQVLTEAAIPSVPCNGAAGGESSAVSAALTALQTNISAACQVPFTNELVLMESGGG